MSNIIAGFNAVATVKPISSLLKQEDVCEHVRLDDGFGYIDGLFKRNRQSDSLVVFFPAALTADAVKNQQYPYLPRWQWTEDVNANVWCFEESLARKYNLAAAWFHERDFFYADILADIIADIAKQLNVPSEKITLMGSSLGGFGALMVAPKIPGSKVIADIAQTDLYTYPIRSAVESFCDVIYGTRDVDALNREFRDRFSVIERFSRLKHFPEMTILHDISDEPNGKTQVYPFLSELGAMQKDFSEPIKIESLIRNAGKGHVALHKFEMIKIINRVSGL